MELMRERKRLRKARLIRHTETGDIQSLGSQVGRENNLALWTMARLMQRGTQLGDPTK